MTDLRAPPPGRTLVEKVLSRASGCPGARAGDIVVATVDFLFTHDGSGPRRWQPHLDRLGVGLWDASRVAIVTDHYVPPADADSAANLVMVRRFAREHEVGAFFDMQGIQHLVLPEHGLIRPGEVIAGGDSHTPMAGAFGAYAAGYGSTDMVGIAVTGSTWIKVPATIRVELEGALPRGVTAKDVMLLLCRELGLENAFLAVDYGGSLVDAMTMHERMVLCNMATELGCETGVVAPDATTFAWLAACGKPVEDEAAALALASDADAAYHSRHRFDVGMLAPQVAAPHSPANVHDVTAHAGVAIDQAYIGACVGAKIDDLRCAAEVLKGRRVAPGVRLLVAPASSKVTQAAAEDGTLATLMAAGATLLPSGCGACAGLGAGVLGPGETCISTTNRNFKGRMGSPQAQVYLASPYAVAAAAVAGAIVDPRSMLDG